MRDFIAYAQFTPFWDRLQPETPFGRAVKESMVIHRDSEALERLWDETEVALALLARLEDDRVSLTRILHHLKRLPRFCEEPRAIYDEVEIFQFKKFLHNFKHLVALLGPEVCPRFQLEYEAEALEQRLDTGRQSAESFYVADAFSEELAVVRREIRETDAALKQQQELRSAEILHRWQVDFASRAFLLIPRQALGAVDAATDLLLVEPYDEDKYVIRPRSTAEELLLQERRGSLLAAERRCELAVLETLSACLREALGGFIQCREAITRFDLAFARARLAREYRLVRPVIHSGPLAVQGGRFIPCEEGCRALGTDYVALDGRFDTPATVLFGSNMGGKTVVLKTLAFLQLCVQTGLFVPAESLLTRLFHHFHYLGEGHAQAVAQGLSGFGFEIRQLVEASADFQAPTLVLFDEFARTTNSLEAEAILSAVLESLQAKADVMAFFSTHFRGVRRFTGVRYLRMKGLNRQGLDLDLASGKALNERIRLIDQRMEFHLVADEGEADVSDAIAVASLLGLDPAIARRAAAFFKNGH